MLASNTTYLSTLPVLPHYTVHNMLHNIVLKAILSACTSYISLQELLTTVAE